MGVYLFCGPMQTASANDAITAPAQTNPALIAPQPPATAPPKADVLPPVDDEVKLDVPKTAPNVQLQVKRFRVERVVVEGVQLLKPQDVADITATVEGRDISLNEMESVVEKLNQLYRSKGYLTSQVVIPPQDISTGTIQLQAVEGRIGELTVTGNQYFRGWVIQRDVGEKPGQPLNLRELEKTLTRINQQNSYRLRATLSPGQQTGTTNVRLDVSERQPWQLSPTVDNQGRPFIGTTRWGAELQNTNLLGLGDRLLLKWLGATGTQAALGSYTLPVNRFGDELNFNYSFGYVNVDLPIQNQPTITGQSHSYGVVYSHPFDKRRHWVGDVGFTYRRISTFISDVRENTDDIAALQTGLTFNRFDRWGRSVVRGQMTFAPGWMDANQKFWKANLFATRVLRLPKNNLLVFRAMTQFTPDALPPAEQFQIGGAFSVRGYTEGLLIGDRGYNFSLEHRWPIPFLRAASPWLASRLQGVTFVDVAGTYPDRSQGQYITGGSRAPNGARLIGSASAERTFLASVGMGLRFRLTRFMSGFVDCGFGLVPRSDVEPYAQPVARLHFGVRSDLLSEALRPFPTSNKPSADVPPPTLPR
jgi:hemolysin activation/secretion protein